jgi:hypothetical protein
LAVVIIPSIILAETIKDILAILVYVGFSVGAGWCAVKGLISPYSILWGIMIFPFLLIIGAELIM